jgi:hypothetical protein
MGLRTGLQWLEIFFGKAARRSWLFQMADFDGNLLRTAFGPGIKPARMGGLGSF